MRYVAIALLMLGLGLVAFDHSAVPREGVVMGAEDGTGWPPPKP